MHQRGRDGAFFDLRVQFPALRLRTAVMKLAKWLPPCFAGGPGLLLFAQARLVLRVAVDGQVALRAVEQVADGVRILRLPPSPMPASWLRHPVAHFEFHHLLLAALVELERAVERVGRLLVVVEHEVAADGADLGRILHAQAPAGDVHFVDALVAEIAVAVIPEPVPVVVEAVLA